MNRAELKAMAKAQIKGKIGVLFLMTLIIGVITGLIGMIPVVGSVATLILSPIFTLSLAMVYLKVIKGVFMVLLAVLAVSAVISSSSNWMTGSNVEITGGSQIG